MSPRAPFLTASDYVFYLRRHLDKEQAELSDNEDPGKENYHSLDMPRLSDLLKNLLEDLRTASAGFVDDIISEQNNGLGLVLDILRISLNHQHCPGMVLSNQKQGLSGNNGRQMKTRDRQHLLKRAMTDEYDCLLCLKHAVQRDSTRALQRILLHRNGLSTLASCIVSNLTKSRSLALQLLTSTCNVEPNGSEKILEAMSTMRIVFGESVRFKLLVSIMNTSLGLEAQVLAFINAMLAKSKTVAERVRLQCELEEAGLNLEQLEKRLLDRKDLPDDDFWLELKKWNESFVDVHEIFKQKRKMVRDIASMKEEIEMLQRALTKLEDDKIRLMEIERELKEKCDDYEAELRSRIAKSGGPRNLSNPSTSPGSDSSDPIACADSGRWSDSDGDANALKKNLLITQSPSSGVDQDTYDTQQNRNEDILIYIPAIRPPANFALKTSATANGAAGTSNANGTTTTNNNLTPGFDHPTTMPIPIKHKELTSAPSIGSEHSQSRYHRRQRNVSSHHNPYEVVDACSVVADQPKPTIIDAYLKKSQSISALNSKQLHRAGSEDEDESSDEPFEWQDDLERPSYGGHRDSKTLRTRSERLQLINNRDNRDRSLCNSMSQLHIDYETGASYRLVTPADNFVLRSRDSVDQCSSPKRRSLVHSTSLSDMSCNSNQSGNFVLAGLAKADRPPSGHPLSSNHSGADSCNGSKSGQTNPQSYYFNGTVSKNGKGSLKDPEESDGYGSSFPVANLYKKSFISKGHGNCGKYSGSDSVSLYDHNGPLSSSSNSNLNIKLASSHPRDLNAWL